MGSGLPHISVVDADGDLRPVGSPGTDQVGDAPNEDDDVDWADEPEDDEVSSEIDDWDEDGAETGREDEAPVDDE